MDHSEVISQIEAVVARHDLLHHPFYQAWTAGTLRAEDLKRYAAEYYHHVAAFPTYLSTLHSRLPDGELRRSILRNLCEEEITGTTHSELWLDFAEGMGANREEVRNSTPSASTLQLIESFHNIAANADPIAALGAFYAYESQVARIAGIKALGLRDKYAADAKTCHYFALHSTQDVHHARVWAERIEEGIDNGSSSLENVLPAVDDAATALWKSLDGLYAGCEKKDCSAN